MVVSAADRLTRMFALVLGEDVKVRVRAWDGSQAGPEEGPCLYVHTPKALRRIVYQPNQVGLARAYVSGEIDVDGDLSQVLDQFGTALETIRPSARAKAEFLRHAAKLGALGPNPKPPPEEIRLSGAKHSRARDQAAIQHHYDLGNDFYRLLLGESMVYSCAYWTTPEVTLEQAQRDKLELICRKLRLRPGMRLLDVGCGWGSLALHAAAHHGVKVVGVTLSQEQVTFARAQAQAHGLTDKVEFRLQDYRDVTDGPFDAISSIGMAEHVGISMYATYCERLYELLRPGGSLLNHQISRHPASIPSKRSFINSYVFPDADLNPIGTTISILERAGFEVRDDEALREHYPRTLRAWAHNLETHWEQAVDLVGMGRARVWKLYITASALGFDRGIIGIHQVLAVKDSASGRSGMPPTRTEWLGVR